MKIFNSLLIVSLLVMMIGVESLVSENDNMMVTVGGKTVSFDVRPRMINDRTVVSFRAIFEALGAFVEWDDETFV